MSSENLQIPLSKWRIVCLSIINLLGAICSLIAGRALIGIDGPFATLFATLFFLCGAVVTIAIATMLRAVLLDRHGVILSEEGITIDVGGGSDGFVAWKNIKTIEEPNLPLHLFVKVVTLEIDDADNFQEAGTFLQMLLRHDIKISKRKVLFIWAGVFQMRHRKLFPLLRRYLAFRKPIPPTIPSRNLSPGSRNA